MTISMGGVGSRLWIVEKRVTGEPWRATVMLFHDKTTAEKCRDKWTKRELQYEYGYSYRVSCWECVEIAK